MSQPYNYYVGNGAQVAFEFTQELNDAATVVGWENGVPKSGSFDTGTGFFTFDVAPTNGADVHVVRATDQNVMVATFPNKSYISSDNLDKNNRQLVNLSEEIAFTLAFRADNAAVYAANAAASAAAAAADAVDTAADVVTTNADVVSTNADVVLTNADVVSTGLDVTYAEEWATKPEDTLVSVAAGGDGVTDYSALHWAAKAAGIATSYVLKAGDTMSGDLSIIKNAGKIAVIDSASNAGMSMTAGTTMSIHATNAVGTPTGTVLNFSPAVRQVTFPIVPQSSQAPSSTADLTRKDYVDSSTVSITGDTMTGNLEVARSLPSLSVKDTGAAVDEGRWDFLSNNGQLTIRAVNDAFSAANNAVTFTRTGSVVNECTFSSQVSSSVASPVAVGHLTRKDYVDSKTAGLNTTVIDIGDWDMNATSAVTIAHGLTLSKIRNVQASVRNDADAQHYNAGHYANTGAPGSQELWIDLTDATNVSIRRKAAGAFDNASFDSTTYNRGWITIQHVD